MIRLALSALSLPPVRRFTPTNIYIFNIYIFDIYIFKTTINMYTKSILVAALAGVAAANQAQPTPGPDAPPPHGNHTVVTTTKVVSQYTTYCPGPTTLSYAGKKYTVTKATTLTITDCPCTIVEVCLSLPISRRAIIKTDGLM